MPSATAGSAFCPRRGAGSRALNTSELGRWPVRVIWYGYLRLAENNLRYIRRKGNHAGWCFYVEGELALTVGRLGGGGHRRSRPAASIINFDLREKQDASATGADGRAEIHILGVEKEALVEHPDRLEVRAAGKQARTADPIDIPRAAGHALDERTQDAVAALDQGLLSQFGERRDHPAKGEFRVPMPIHDPRPDDGHLWILIKLGNESIDRYQHEQSCPD